MRGFQTSSADMLDLRRDIVSTARTDQGVDPKAEKQEGGLGSRPASFPVIDY